MARQLSVDDPLAALERYHQGEAWAQSIAATWNSEGHYLYEVGAQIGGFSKKDPIDIESIVQNPHGPQSMRDLAQIVFSGYNRGAPIAIARTGENSILITIAGTEWGVPDQANTFPHYREIIFGQGIEPFTRAVDDAVSNFLKAHPEMHGKALHADIAGHSLGGNEAMKCAALYTAKNRDPTTAVSGELHNSLHIDNVVTFGECVGPDYRIHLLSEQVQVHRFRQEGDFIPVLSMRDPHSLRGIASGVIGIAGRFSSAIVNGPTGQLTQVTPPLGLVPLITEGIQHDLVRNFGFEHLHTQPGIDPRTGKIPGSHGAYPFSPDLAAIRFQTHGGPPAGGYVRFSDLTYFPAPHQVPARGR